MRWCLGLAMADPEIRCSLLKRELGQVDVVFRGRQQVDQLAHLGLERSLLVSSLSRPWPL